MWVNSGGVGGNGAAAFKNILPQLLRLGLIASHTRPSSASMASSASTAKVTPPGSRRRRIGLYVGHAGGDFMLDVAASDTFGNVRATLQDITGIPPDQQTLRIMSRDLWVDHPEEDGRTLADYDIQVLVHIELGRS